jgi:uncharacterized protein (DUF2235 family)
MSKNIVFCADGTWNGLGEPDSDDKTANVTNVFKTYPNLDGVDTADTFRLEKEQERALTAADGTVQQIAKYLHGVGDSDNFLVKALGGALGAGLITRIVRGYTFVSRNYVVGDGIYLIGFSRGAYTARALAGLIAVKGLLDATQLDLADKERAYRLGSAVWYDHRRAQLRDNKVGRLEETVLDLPGFLMRPPRSDQLVAAPIEAVAVWETVGALGIPAFNAAMMRVDNLQFVNLALSPKVRHGLHAVAVDEIRADFTPTLWDADPRITQVLFVGAHGDVGGGYPLNRNESGLSDGPLKWMTVQLAQLGVRFSASPVFVPAPDAKAPAHSPWMHPPWICSPKAHANFPVGWVCTAACWIGSQAATWSPRDIRLHRISHRIWPAISTGRSPQPGSSWWRNENRRHRLPRKPRHDLHVGGITELIDRRHLAEAIAAVDQDFGVARECRGVARHRHDGGHAALGEFARLRFGALARWIEHHCIEAGKFLGDKRAAEQVAPLRRNRLETAGGSAGTAQRVDGVGVAVGGDNAGALGEPEREWSDAGEQVGDRLGGAGVLEHEPRQRFFSEGCRLQEGAGRQRHGGAPDPHLRLGALRHQLAVAGNARQPVGLGDTGERESERRRERTRSAHIHVDAVIGCGRLDVERLCGGLERLGDRPGGVDEAVKTGRQDRASIDRNDPVGMQRSEADFQNIAGAAPRVQYGAAAALAVGIDEVGDGRRDAGVTELRRHCLALPGAIRRRVPMLERAAAAHAEVWADRRDARGARRLDAQEVAPVRMAGPGIDLNDFARQRIRHIDRPCAR